MVERRDAEKKLEHSVAKMQHLNFWLLDEFSGAVSINR